MCCFSDGRRSNQHQHLCELSLTVLSPKQVQLHCGRPPLGALLTPPLPGVGEQGGRGGRRRRDDSKCYRPAAACIPWIHEPIKKKLEKSSGSSCRTTSSDAVTSYSSLYMPCCSDSSFNSHCSLILVQAGSVWSNLVWSLVCVLWAGGEVRVHWVTQWRRELSPLYMLDCFRVADTGPLSVARGEEGGGEEGLGRYQHQLYIAGVCVFSCVCMCLCCMYPLDSKWHIKVD